MNGGTGEVVCWGNNLSGQLGDGDAPNDKPSPVYVETAPGTRLAGAQALALGGQHSCALLGTSEVRCWGRNDQGQLGNASQGNSSRAVAVLQATAPDVNLVDVEALAAGFQHSCALAGGQVRCWGNNALGQLGNPAANSPQTTAAFLVKTSTSDLSNVTSLAAGDGHNCVLVAGGPAHCWGDNTARQLGDGSVLSQQPQAVPVLQAAGGLAFSNALALSLGHFHSCARVAGSEARCWGSDAFGQIGNGTPLANVDFPATVSNPSQSGALTAVAGLDLGYDHSCASSLGGGAFCWGFNFYGQLGNGQVGDDSDVSIEVLASSTPGDALGNVQTLSAGREHTCALMTDNQVRCWGRNDQGQIGDGSPGDVKPFPTPVALPLPRGGGRRTLASAARPGAWRAARAVATHRSRCALFFHQCDLSGPG